MDTVKGNRGQGKSGRAEAAGWAEAPPGFVLRRGALFARVKLNGSDRIRRVSGATLAEARAEREAFARELKTEAEAAERAAAVAARGPGLRWDEAVVRFLRSAQQNLKPGTYSRYTSCILNAESSLAGLSLPDINKRVLIDFIESRRRDGATNATINRDLTAISQVFEYAIVTLDGIDANPVAMLPRKKLTREIREPIDPPAEPDVLYALANLSPMLSAITRFCAETGCRQAEATALESRHGELDLERGTCNFLRTKVNRPRVIDLHPDTVAWLRSLPRSPKGNWTFWVGEGTPFEHIKSEFWRSLRGVMLLAEREGVAFRRFRFHDLRHRFATQMLEAGADLYGLSRHLGHSTVKVTEEYLRMVSAARRERAIATGGLPVRSLPLPIGATWAAKACPQHRVRRPRPKAGHTFGSVTSAQTSP